MKGPLSRYLIPGICGAIVSFLVRLFFANFTVAVIGFVVFGIVYAAILLLAQAMKWQDAPVLYAATSAVGVTVAFLVTGPHA